MVYWMHVRSQLLTLIEGGGATQGKRRKTKKKERETARPCNGNLGSSYVTTTP